jgi:hypothetical protein
MCCSLHAQVVITVENSFLLRRGDPMDSGINSSSSSLAKTFRARLEKAKLRMDPLKVMGGARKNKDKVITVMFNNLHFSSLHFQVYSNQAYCNQAH